MGKIREVVDKVTGEILSLRDSIILSNRKGKPLTEDGQEMPDPVPVAPPIGFVEQPDMFQKMREMIRGEQLRAAALAAGAETFDEAEDFDVGDDLDPTSPYEDVFEGLSAREIDERIAALREARYRLESPEDDLPPPAPKGGATEAPRGRKRPPKPVTDVEEDEARTNKRVDSTLT